MKYFLITFFVLLIFCVDIHAQYNYDSSKINKQVLKLVNKISRAKQLEGVYIGFVGERSQTYALYKKMRELAKKEELTELTNHPNPIVRSYAFWGLAERKEDNIFPIILKHIDDTITMKVLFADVFSYEKVGNFMIKLIIPTYIFTADYLFTNKTSISDSEKTILDSTVIFKENSLEYTSIVLQNVEPLPHYYERIKTLAQDGNIFAVIALSKFQKYEDIELIKKSRDFSKNHHQNYPAYYYTFKAIANFPHEDFWSYLIEMKQKLTLDNIQDIRNFKTLYEAIASYKKSECIPYLTSENSSLSLYSLLATEKYNSSIFDSLKFRIWEGKNIITLKSFNYLFTVDSTRTTNNIFKTLSIDNKYLEIPGLDIFIRHIYHLQAGDMIDTLMVIDSIKTLNLINLKLYNSEYKELELYCKKAINIKDLSFIETIFKRLSNSDEVYKGDDYWYLLEVVLSYKNAEIEKKLINVLKKYSNLKNVEDKIDLIKRSMDRTNTFDEIFIDKYR